VVKRRVPKSVNHPKVKKIPLSDKRTKRLVDLADCVEFLKKTGNLVQINSEIDPNYVLAGIAKKFEGVSATDILRLNNISDASRIQVGQKLRIRKKS